MSYNLTHRALARLGVLASAALVATVPLVAAAEDVSFAGKRIEGIVPAGEGGAGDTYIRYIAPRLVAQLPGDPTVVIRNIPGGGTIIGSNWFDAHAPKDGTAVMTIGTSTTLTYALRSGSPEVQYDPRGWRAFMASPMGRVVFAHSSTGIKSIEDLRDYDGELLMAIESPTGSNMPSMLALDLLGADIKAVSGVDGGDETLAFQRGELEVGQQLTSTYLQNIKPLVDDGTAVPLFTFGLETNGEIVRDPNFPDLPNWVEAYEIVYGKAPSGTEFEVWKALFQMAVMSSKPMLLPEGTPDDVYDTYVAAAEALIADPEFVETHAQFVGAYPQLTGEAAQSALDGSVSLSPEALEWVTKWVEERFDIQM
jgi:tripartite-type tricarboxylate transporter receptor subunit TctC